MSWPDRMRSTASCTVRIAWMTTCVEDARPGVGQQDLRFEGQAVKTVGDAAIEALASAQLVFDPDEGRFKLRHLGGRHRLASAQARQEPPFVFSHTHVRRTGFRPRIGRS